MHSKHLELIQPRLGCFTCSLVSFHGLKLANEDKNEKGLNACFTDELQAGARSIVTCEFATM